MDKPAYMRRALQLAALGRGFASPNPMVGAVIVAPGGRIIGEGWHRRCGDAHAEVNAVKSVSGADRPLLRESTMYVTLEPCAHYGKTPPCAEMIVREGIPRVEVATVDPFAKVAGRGIGMLRDAGVAVNVGLLEKDARELNRVFFHAHTSGRPWVSLKWARTADGFMDWKRDVHLLDEKRDVHLREENGVYVRQESLRISNALTSLATMDMRAVHDAVLTTSATVSADDCRLTVRGLDGRQPRKIVLDRNARLCGSESVFAPDTIHVCNEIPLKELLESLYRDYGLTSVLVEGGPTILNRFIDGNLWDFARVETAPGMTLGEKGVKEAPVLPDSKMTGKENFNGNEISYYLNEH